MNISGEDVSDVPQAIPVEGFEEEGMFITIYNHPYYVKHLEVLGFIRDIDWVGFQVFLPEEPDKKMEQLSAAVLKKHKIRLYEPTHRRELESYIGKNFELYNTVYATLYGTVLLSGKQIKKYYDQFIFLVNAEYVKLLLDENDTLVGFGLAITSMNRAVKSCKGRLFPFGWYQILRAPFAKTKVLDLYLVGVLPRMQNKGLTAVLMSSMTATARKSEIEIAETGPELESNSQVQALWKFYKTRQHKRRRCWIKSL